ncbi:PepSY domain-containing protein [Salinimonas sp. HHU 13199]|uniref:PepSY domain-containing protein n=1 Tax=Salinimonas profundi TaxID=2729140 RepID=A0ABR8LGS6_9ALTE|nr:PepSY domain-containing protein [Salinimonas profundi]MBD3584738.1 PepSY domain-containing protein [Salinimonas profundi]
MIDIVRRYHRWLMLFVALQFLLWAVSGLYMVSMDIHYIHGENLVNAPQVNIDNEQRKTRFETIVDTYPNAESVTLRSLAGTPVYQVLLSDQPTPLLIATDSGQPLPQINEQQAARIAVRAFAGQGNIESIRSVDQPAEAPDELSPHHLPVWQVNFDETFSPTLYISQYTGSIVTVRHHPWRWFDWMWRLHILDWDDGATLGNLFFLIFAFTGLAGALSGAILSYLRIVKPAGRGDTL